MTSAENAPNDRAVDLQPSGDASASRVLRVLVADDFDVVRDLMRRIVEKLGHVVDEVEDGQEAVTAIMGQRYDLLLLDLTMPRMSGIDVVRWLNAHPEHLDGMTVAIVSASAHDERPILNELGISLFLPKPLRRQELTDLINRLAHRP